MVKDLPLRLTSSLSMLITSVESVCKSQQEKEMCLFVAKQTWQTHTKHLA